VARETNVSIARMTEWRERAVAGAATALKERERDDRDDEARLKSNVGEITMDNELLYAKIEALDNMGGGQRRCARRAFIIGVPEEDGNHYAIIGRVALETDEALCLTHWPRS
jgi:hypothetical protein